jgi:hypothetical protein
MLLASGSTVTDASSAIEAASALVKPVVRPITDVSEGES